MRSTLTKLLLAVAVSLVPFAVNAKAHPKTMSVQLADGKTVTFHVMKMHGQMMLVAPVCTVNPVQATFC